MSVMLFLSSFVPEKEGVKAGRSKKERFFSRQAIKIFYQVKNGK